MKKPKRSEYGESEKVDSNEYSSWSFPESQPKDTDIKNMLAEAMSFAVKLIMNNHIIMFGDEIYVQSDEGSTGVRLTGILAEIVMILWCSELSRRLEKASIQNDMLPRFVDDITMCPTVIPPGWKLVGLRFQFQVLV